MKMVTHVKSKVLQNSKVYVLIFRASLALTQCLEQLGEAKTLHAHPRSTRSPLLEAAKYFSALHSPSNCLLRDCLRATTCCCGLSGRGNCNRNEGSEPSGAEGLQTRVCPGSELVASWAGEHGRAAIPVRMPK